MHNQDSALQLSFVEGSGGEDLLSANILTLSGFVMSKASGEFYLCVRRNEWFNS